MSSATVSTSLAAPGKGERTALKPSQNARRQTATGIPDVPKGVTLPAFQDRPEPTAG